MSKANGKTSGKKNRKGAEAQVTLPRELVVITKAGDGAAAPAAMAVTPLADALASAGASIAPLFNTTATVGETPAAMSADDTAVSPPELARFYHVEAPDDALDDLAKTLANLDEVEAAYVKPVTEAPFAPDTIIAPAEEVVLEIDEEAPAATPDFVSRQVYLNAAPEGVDARYAWTIAGGRGAGVNIIDVEGAWRLTHEDLMQHQGGLVAGSMSSNIDWRNHGTAVVGVMGGDENSRGVTGISPDAYIRVASIFGGTGSATAIQQAADALSAGDLLLIELHRPGPRFSYESRDDQRGYIAIEWWPDDYAAIRYATNKGVIVVEAAGNGAEDLDDGLYNIRPLGFPGSWSNPFNMSNPSSQAVLVGAGAPPPGTHGRDHGPDRSRLGFSNYGTRLDAQGWGREVTTTGYGGLWKDPDSTGNEDKWYTDTFSGTSSSSPVVVGSLACVQGVLHNQGGTLLTPASARQLLRTTGSPQQDAPGRPKTQRIGSRPDIREMIAAKAKVWTYNAIATTTFASIHAENAWVHIQGMGWRKIETGSADGVSNMFNAFCEAVANNRRVHIYADASKVYIMYLV